MFNKRYRYLVLGTAALSLVLMLFLTLFSTGSSKVDSNPFAEHPGWFQHYAERKGLDPSNIDQVAGLKMKWHEADMANLRFNKKNTGALENVQEIGPSNIGGRTRSICIDWNDPDHILSGGVSGGLWASNNKGVNWEPIDDQAATLAVVGITQSPFDSDVFYYTTGESTRGLLNINGLGVFKSTDGGQNFTHLEHTAIGAFSATWDIKHSLTMDSTIYVATNTSGLYRSTDAGASFQRIFSTSTRVHEIHVFEDSTIMITVNGNGIHRIDERTLQSTKLSGLPTSGFSRIAMDYCDSDPDIIYAHFAASSGQQFHSAWKSTDRGATWTQTTSPSGNYAQAWYDFKVAVSPTDPDFVLSLAVNFNWTRNGGSSWSSSNSTGFGNGSHADYHEVQFYDDGITFLVGNDGGIYRYSKNNISSYTDLNFSYNVTQFYAGFYHPSNNDVIAGAQDNWTLYSPNGNVNYGQLMGGDGSFCAISQQDPDIMYYSSQYLNLWRDVNGSASGGRTRIRDFIYNSIGGQSFTYFINPIEINLYDGNQLYVPTRKEVYRTTNAGSSWTAVTADLPGNTFAVGLSHDVNPTAYFGGTGSLIHRLDNAQTNAQNEVMITSSAPVDFRGSNINNITVDPNDAGTIYVSLTNISIRPRVWKITDANTDNPEWHDISANLPESLPVNWIEVDPKDSKLLIIATDYGVYTSVNGGGWWQKDERFPNVTVEQLRLRHSDRKLYAFTHGRGAWSAELADNPTSSIDEITSAWSIYPNPATDELHVKAQGLSSVRIFDHQGKTVLESSKNLLDLRGLSNGTYFVEIQTEQARSVEKLLITGR